MGGDHPPTHAFFTLPIANSPWQPGTWSHQKRTVTVGVKGTLRREILAGRRVPAAIPSKVSPPASISRRRARFRGRRGTRRLLRLSHRAFRPQPEPPPIHVRARTCDPRRSIQVRGTNAYRPGSSLRGPLAGGRVPAAAACGAPAPAPFRRRRMGSRGNRVQSEASGEKNSPEDESWI